MISSTTQSAVNNSPYPSGFLNSQAPKFIFFFFSSAVTSARSTATSPCRSQTFTCAPTNGCRIRCTSMKRLPVVVTRITVPSSRTTSPSHNKSPSFAFRKQARLRYIADFFIVFALLEVSKFFMFFHLQQWPSYTRKTKKSQTAARFKLKTRVDFDAKNLYSSNNRLP